MKVLGKVLSAAMVRVSESTTMDEACSVWTRGEATETLAGVGGAVSIVSTSPAVSKLEKPATNEVWTVGVTEGVRCEVETVTDSVVDSTSNCTVGVGEPWRLLECRWRI